MPRGIRSSIQALCRAGQQALLRRKCRPSYMLLTHIPRQKGIVKWKKTIRFILTGSHSVSGAVNFAAGAEQSLCACRLVTQHDFTRWFTKKQKSTWACDSKRNHRRKRIERSQWTPLGEDLLKKILAAQWRQLKEHSRGPSRYTLTLFSLLLATILCMIMIKYHQPRLAGTNSSLAEGFLVFYKQTLRLYEQELDHT